MERFGKKYITQKKMEHKAQVKKKGGPHICALLAPFIDAHYTIR